MAEQQEIPKSYLQFSDYQWKMLQAAAVICELHPEWEADIYQVHDSIIVAYNPIYGKEVLLGITEALGKCTARPAKIGTRVVPTESHITIRGVSRLFRTIFKTVKRFGILYYGNTVTARDLGFDAFKEELGKEKRRYQIVNGVPWTGRTRKLNK